VGVNRSERMYKTFDLVNREPVLERLAITIPYLNNCYIVFYDKAKARATREPVDERENDVMPPHSLSNTGICLPRFSTT
jgi:hypothetical protein